MPKLHWSRVIALLIGLSTTASSGSASAFQFPLPLNSEVSPRHLHDAENWVGGGFQSSGNINQAPADFGPIFGMNSRTADGSPAAGDSFPIMEPGPLPGGLSRDGFNSSGMRPPVNQPWAIANNPVFGGSGSNSGAPVMPAGRDVMIGPNGQIRYGSPNIFGQRSQPGTNRGVTANGQPQQRPRPVRAKMVVAADARHSVVGLMGQVARPGAYELPSEPLRLGELIERIGGLAKHAGGQFRVVRNGRPSQTLSYYAAAQFELQPGDLVIADSGASHHWGESRDRDSSASTRSSSSAGAVQIGFVNLLDRPVVLKLRSELATVAAILDVMRQDAALASRVKVLLPSGRQSSDTQHPDAPLPSESVLIFPPNSVAAGRLAALPEPLKLDGNPPESSSPPAENNAPGNISPEVTQRLPASPESPRVAEIPPPPGELMTSARNASVGVPSATGSRGTVQHVTPDTNRAARDSDLTPAPPAESNTPDYDRTGREPTASRPLRDVSVPNEATSSPKSEDSLWSEIDERASEPSRLTNTGNRKPIHLAERHNDPVPDANGETDLTSLEVDKPLVNSKKSGSTLSFWPPILTAVAGLIGLVGFSLSLRRRTLAAQQHPSHAPQPPMKSNVGSQPKRQQILEALINNQLPITEEKVAIASPLQFHGRPNPPRTLRVDPEHSLPQPHTPSLVKTEAPAATTAAPVASSPSKPAVNFRLDPVEPASPARASTDRKPATKNSSATIGVLDRALSAVQQRGVRA